MSDPTPHAIRPETGEAPRATHYNAPCDMAIGPCACGAWHDGAAPSPPPSAGSAEERLREAVTKFNWIVTAVEARCMAADGPVTPTLKEMREDELRDLWLAVQSIRRDVAGK